MRKKILAFLENFELEGGGNIISRDLIRALDVDGSKVSFVLESAVCSENFTANIETTL